MVTKIILLSALLSFVGGCEKKHKERVIPKAFGTENIDELIGYVFTDEYTYVVDLEKNTILREIKLPEKIQNVFAGDTIMVAGEFLWELVNEAFQKLLRLPDTYKDIIKEGEQIYILREKELYVGAGASLRVPRPYDGRVLELGDLPIKFIVAFDKIWLLDENGLSIYRVSDFQEEYRIPVEKAADFALSFYGIRLYIASRHGGTIDIFDTKKITRITTISIKDTINTIKYVQDKLYCLGNSGVYLIDRTTNKIERILRVNRGEDLVLSNDGTYGIVLLDSTIVFFNTDAGEISKYLNLKVMDITTTPGGSRIYCLTPDGLITINAKNFEIESRIRVSNGKKVIINEF